MRSLYNSIAYKILVPILVLLVVIAVMLLILVHNISSAISEDYQHVAVARYTDDVQRILDTAVSELTSARLMGVRAVVEVKQRSVIEALNRYWSEHELDGVIVGKQGGILFTSFNDTWDVDKLLSRDPGRFSLLFRGARIHGQAAEFAPWGWTVVSITRPLTPLFLRREVRLIVPLIAAGSLLMVAGVFVILQRKVRRPVQAMLHDINAGHTVQRTGVSELDDIGAAVNEAISKLTRKTEQYQILHNLAISVHEILSVDDILKVILERAGGLIKAELAAIVLYDDAGGFKNLISRGVMPGAGMRTPAGKGILEAVRLSLAPLRINEVKAHPAFSGGFPPGHPVVQNVLGYPIFSDEGKPLGALYFGNKPGGFTDEDESVLRAVSADAAIALNKAERITQLKRFQEVIESAFDVIIITDKEGKIEYVNHAFESVTGFTKHEVIGKTTRILRSDRHPEEFYQQLWSTVTEGRAWKGELINRKSDGSTYYASAVIFPIKTQDGVNIVAVQRDITQEKRLYEQLLRAQKMEAIGTLAGGIAHEFNNLLAGILGYAEIILKQSAEGDPFHKPASIVHQAARRGSDLAKKILIITRKEKLEARAVDLNEIVQDTVDLLQKSIPKNIEIALNLTPQLPLVKADPTQIQQVVMNLSMNARDAMPDGGRIVIETAVVGAENGAVNKAVVAASGFVKLSVSDTGQGMDVETQRRIFDPFFTTKETGKGTGLGLFIVHSVVNNHGGYINLYSEPGKGTRFNVYFPYTAGLVPEEPEIPADLRGTGTILVIDDEQHIRELCKDILHPLGYRVLAAENGEEAVRLFRERKDEVDLVILDMVMPRMSGSEVFHALKRIKPGVRVLLFSGYSQNGFAGIDALLRDGGKGFIQKPFTQEALAAEIKNILAK